MMMAHARVCLAVDDGEETEEEIEEEIEEEEESWQDEAEKEGDSDEDEVKAEEEKQQQKKKKKKKGKKSKASLLIPVSEEGATVVIDGDEVGVTPIAPITGLTVGKHQIEVIKDGFHDYMGFVEIPGEGTIRYDIMLEGGKRKKIKVPKFLKTWWFWTAVGAVVATGVGVGIYYGVKPEEPSAVHFPPY